MQKREILSLFKNLLPRYDKTARFHPAIVAAAVEKVLSEMYQEVWQRNPTDLLSFTKGYGYSTTLPVVYENSTGIYYTTLPIAPIPIPDNASGVRRINTKVRSGFSFFATNKAEVDNLESGSLANTVTVKTGYIVTPTRVEYYNISGTAINDGVRMDLLIKFSNYADTDEVMIPETVDAQGNTFIPRVLAILGVIPPVDLKDNNAEMTQQSNNKA